MHWLADTEGSIDGGLPKSWSLAIWEKVVKLPSSTSSWDRFLFQDHGEEASLASQVDGSQEFVLFGTVPLNALDYLLENIDFGARDVFDLTLESMESTDGSAWSVRVVGGRHEVSVDVLRADREEEVTSESRRGDGAAISMDRLQ